MIRLAVRCAPAAAELVLAELLELAPGGVEEERGADWVEYAIYGAEGELPDLGEVRAQVATGTVQVKAESVPDDWADRWRDFHRPTEIAGRVVIRPSWHAGATAAHALDVVLDPGQAFGTGAHPTTRMCVELLLELSDAGGACGSLADLGTGSAVLAIVAAKLGWHPVLGVDHERPSVEAARANATANSVEARFERLDLRADAPPAAETIVANLTAPLLRDVAPRLHGGVQRVVCSGILRREVEAAERAFGAVGLVVAERRHSGDWAALLCARRR